MKENIILFDGECNLCDNTIRYIIRNDKLKVFKFSSLQSDFAKNLLISNKIKDSGETVILFYENSFFIESDAMLIILKNLKGFNRFLSFILGLTPKFLRDFFYRIISKNRYKIFGNKTYCNHKEYNEYIERFFQ